MGRRSDFTLFDREKIIDYQMQNLHLTVAEVAKTLGYPPSVAQYAVGGLITIEERRTAKLQYKLDNEPERLSKAELIELVKIQREIIQSLRGTALALRGIKSVL